ncbi:DUF2835 domain-containing protein [Thermochromatium tepidum]|jgi:hypothetical protein|uniref:DUF2835 family protein n=1 Tax=Thermochromatium tepidum ATCC 43061 TaxID=316276 RepID=A0A6I6E3N6_THETI|nr:DUF2835 domain-containing protein [Thermochromatium tepidum]QGU33565.1 DUF2835 family protein [Thermochromatium tepidum ATCC 43061]
MRYFHFSLNIPSTEYLRYYQGAAARVVVRTQDGRTLSIPAINLRQFVTHAGIQGRFRAAIDENNRLVALERH